MNVEGRPKSTLRRGKCPMTERRIAMLGNYPPLRTVYDMSAAELIRNATLRLCREVLRRASLERDEHK
jgi:hypothetical protein